MPNFNCVEPAQANANDHTVVSATAADQITFPDIDSCFAIGLVLSDGSLVGGHVPALLDDKAFTLEFSKLSVATKKGQGYDATTGGMKAALEYVLGLMGTARNGRTATLAVTLGDQEWYEHWDAVAAAVGYPKKIRYEKDFGARNLIMDGATNSISVQKKIAGIYTTNAVIGRTFGQGTINTAQIAC